MKIVHSKLSIIIFLLAPLFLSSCGYNRMVDTREEVDKTWANVQNQYQRRADLIPNLVKTVKAYADFEQETLTKVIEARSKATAINIDPSNLDENALKKFQAAQGELSGALSRLLVTIERYPDLKANQNFLEFQSQLEGTENRINVARDRYNEAVKAHNAYIRKFPQVIYSGWFGFKTRPYFEAEAGSDEAPDVDFGS